MAKPTSGQMKEFWDLVGVGRVTKKNFQAFLRNPQGYTNGKPSEYFVTIDYEKSLEQMIAAGRYDWKSDDINSKNFSKKFSITGEGVVEVKLELIHLSKMASQKEIEVYLEVNGLRVATLEELLAFGATYPDVQREFPVIALGSSWVDQDGARCAPGIDGGRSERNLNLSPEDEGYLQHYRVLAVPLG